MLNYVIGNSIRLYRSHLKSYLLLSLTANLWLLLPLFFLSVTGILLNYNPSLVTNYPFVGTILTLIGVFSFLYASSKYLLNAAIISRLAYRELINQPETVNSARIQLAPRQWSFLFASILAIFLRLIITVASICLYLIVAGIFAFIIGGLVFSGGGVLSLVQILSFFSIIIYLSIFTFCIWFYCKLFIYDIPLAIEDKQDAYSTITRCWYLSSESAWQICWVCVVALLVTVPLDIVTQILWLAPTVADIANNVLWDADNIINQNNTSSWLSLIESFKNVFIWLQLTLTLLVRLIFLPLWQIIKGAIYSYLSSDVVTRFYL